MSHVVLGRRSTLGELVEHIERVVSVDIVAFPATTRSFQEGTQPDEWMQQLLSGSPLPAVLCTESVRQALLQHPDPGQLLKVLEEWAGLLQREAPQSSGKRAVIDESLSTTMKQTLISAIKGK